MMNCEHIRAKLVAYAEGRLSVDQREWVEAHVKECASCQTALARLDVVAAALVQLDTPPVPGGLTAGIMARARQREEPASAWTLRDWWREAAAPMRAASVAALVAGVAIGLAMGQTSYRETASYVDVTPTMERDPLDLYGVGLLGEMEEASLPGAYFKLVSPADR